MAGAFRTDLEPIVMRAEAAILDVVRQIKLLTKLREASAQKGLPPDSFTFQSQETVDRDYEGSWFYAMR